MKKDELTQKLYTLAHERGALDYLLSVKSEMDWRSIAIDKEGGYGCRLGAIAKLKREWGMKAAERLDVKVSENPYGMNFTAHSYVITEDAMISLLYHAYIKGVEDARPKIA